MYINRGRGRGRGRSYHVTQANTQGPETPEPVTRPQPSPSGPLVIDRSNIVTVNLDLDEATENWLAQLRSSWVYLKKSPSIVNMIVLRFESCASPYEEALRLMYNCVDFKYAKPKSLAFLILDEFRTWCSFVRNKIVHTLTPDVKVSAFNIVRRQNIFSFMKLAAEVYEMSTDCDMFLDVIHHMIQQKQYKEACQSAALLGLHKKFGINEFLVPLILQDKIIVAEDFLADSPDHQLELVGFLDTVLGKNSSIRNNLEYFVVENDVAEVKWDKLHYKAFRKLITRLKKNYNLGDEVTPSLIKKQNEGALQFLVHRRYIENTIGDESFKEMVHEAVRDDPKLQLDLVIQVAHHFDLLSAMQMALNYKIPKENWPYNLRMFQDNPEQDRHQQQNASLIDEPWDLEETTPNKEFYKLKLPFHSLHLIDCENTFESFLEVGLQDVAIVGIDCEWKPSFGSQKNELALIQIATRKDVYIVDVVNIGSDAAHLWQRLGKTCFNNCDILKLGFGLIGDMSMMRQSLQHLNINQKVGFLDLLNLWKQIEKNSKVKFPFDGHSGGPSLSTLVQQCLGLPLDKSDQFSNWERRPLRRSQIEYAALDAYCLIEVYDVLRECCEKEHFAFDEACYSLMSSSKVNQKKSKKHFQKRKRHEQILPQPANPDPSMVRAEDIKFVCDTMIQGLGKNLRKCGIDTAILQEQEDHMNCVKMYQDEQRFIVTRGLAFNKLSGSVPHGHCFRVTENDLNDQLKEVLAYFNIVVRKENIFSRCQLCNANSFIKISKSTMHTLVQSSQKKASEVYRAECYADDFLADEATGFSSEEDYDDDIVQHKPVISKKWELCSDEHVDVGLCQTRLGAQIQVSSIPDGTLAQTDLYYVCEQCGKVYWDGTHLDRILSSKLQGIVI